MASIGRNEPCSCGSGKKYKKCCMRPTGDGNEQTRQRLNRISNNLIKKLLHYAEGNISDVQKNELKDIFLCGYNDLPQDILEPIMSEAGFGHWFCYHCRLDEKGENEPLTLGEHYLKEKGHQLDKESQAYLTAMLQTTHSFYKVVETRPGYSMTMQDMLLGTQCTVYEKLASEQVSSGSVMFGCVVNFAGINTFVGVFGIILPSDIHLDLANLKENIEATLDAPLNENTIGHFDAQEIIRSTCFNILHKRYAQEPVITNKDGQSFEFNTAEYRLTLSKEETLQKLVDILPPGETPETIIANRKNDKIEFPWLDKSTESAFGHSVLAHITLIDDTLLLETNATNRSAKMEVMLEDYLKGGIIKHTHKRESLADISHKSESQPQENNTEQPGLSEAEIESLTKQMLTKHWDNWLDQHIPALDNLTPREAASDPLHRKKLEALLADFETQYIGKQALAPDVTALRNKLGLRSDKTSA